jgi:hypothetical protein
MVSEESIQRGGPEKVNPEGGSYTPTLQQLLPPPSSSPQGEATWSSGTQRPSPIKLEQALIEVREEKAGERARRGKQQGLQRQGRDGLRLHVN